MDLLILKAVKEIDAKLQRVSSLYTNMSDNLNDIELYLNENSESLPEKGEVQPGELFKMVADNKARYDSIGNELSTANDWVKAILNSK